MKRSYIIIYSTIVIVGLFGFSHCQPKKEQVNSQIKDESNPLNSTIKANDFDGDDHYNVAFLVMDGTFNTELTAPYDIFHHTKFRKGVTTMKLFTVANQTESITTFEGLRIKPDFDYTGSELPRIDILVIPAAEHNLDTDLKDTVLMNFIRKTSVNAKYVMSHCDGAFILAGSGVLDNAESTTFPGDVEAYRQMFPHLKVHDSDSIIFVHDGKFITSAGGAKSFEPSLYLCEMLYGKEIADKLAGGMVIDWDLAKTPYIKVE